MKKYIFAATITGALFMANFANAQKEATGAAPKQKNEPAKTEKTATKAKEANAVKAVATEPKAKTSKPATAKKEEPKATKAPKQVAEKK